MPSNPLAQQPPINREPPIPPPAPTREPLKPKPIKPPDKTAIPQPQEPTTQREVPSRSCQRIGEGPDRFKDCSDEQVGRWAMEEADKIKDMARKSLDESRRGMRSGIGRPANGPIYFFAIDFGKCCAQDVESLRNEILARLGPSGKDPAEMLSWEGYISSRNALPENYQPSWPSPMSVELYAPYLHGLGSLLYRKAVPTN